MSRRSVPYSTQLAERRSIQFVGSILSKNPSPMTLKQWLEKLHALASHQPMLKGSVSTLGRPVHSITRLPRNETSDWLFKSCSNLNHASSLLRMAIMTRLGCGSRTVCIVTDTTTIRCSHTIFYIPHSHMILAFSQRNTPIIHTTRTNSPPGKRQGVLTISGNTTSRTAA